MLARILRTFDTPVDVLTAETSEEALRLAGDGVDILITDYLLPGTSGLQLIQQMRERVPHLQTILITAHDAPGLQEDARQHNVRELLIKPVQPARVREAVAAALNHMAAAQAEPRDDQRFDQRPRILVVDDQPDTVELFSFHLDRLGYACVPAYNGDEALARAQSHQPDLVLLDVDMPGMNGFDVLRALRRDPVLRHVPVIMMTASLTSPSFVSEGFGLGADDYLAKPFDWEELDARMAAKLRVKQSQDSLLRRNWVLGQLPDIGNDLNRQHEIVDVAQVVLRRTVNAIGATDADLVVVDSSGELRFFMLNPRRSATGDLRDARERLLVEGLAADVFARGRTVLVRNLISEERWVPWNQDGRFVAAVAAPLVVRRGTIGVLLVYHHTEGAFGTEQMSLVESIARQAAATIENVQMYALYNRQLAQMQALPRLTTRLAMSPDDDDRWEQLPEWLCQLFALPAAAVWRVQGEALQVAAMSTSGAMRWLRDLPPDELSRAPRQVAASGRSAILTESRAGDPAEDDAAPAGQAYAVLLVPVKQHGQVVGVLSAYRESISPFSANDRLLLDAVAAVFSLQTPATLSDAPDVFTVASPHRVLDEATMDAVLHDLRNPLTAILGYGKLLQGRQSGPLNFRQQSFVERIVNSADRMMGLVNGIRLLARAQRGLDHQPRRVDLVGVLRQVVAAARDERGITAIEFEPPDETCFIEADPRELETVFDALFDNALRYSPDNSPISLSFECGDDRCVVRVQDRGIGIREEDLPHLYQPLFRADVETVRAVPGHGLGLSIAHTLLTLHRASLSIKSQPGSGTTVIVSFPRLRDL